MIVDAGKLNKRITIFQDKKVQDSETGFVTTERKVVRQCYAQINNTSGKEVFTAGRSFSEVKKRFLIRYAPIQLDTTMKIEYQDNIYEINYINNYGDSNEFIEVICSGI